MKKVLIICGPTATGKTKLSLRLAQQLNGELISADSRQIYKDMNIGTGKGLPKDIKPLNSNFYTDGEIIKFYEIDGIIIWGYDLAQPNEEFDVSRYQKSMSQILESIWQKSKTPILVGGTGFYINSLINPPETIGIPINPKLREELEKEDISTLQNELKKLKLQRFNSMNNSDKNNPRRLIRAIEVENYFLSQVVINKTTQNYLKNVEICWIGLTADLSLLKQKVTQNVKQRATEKFTQEILRLEKKGFDWNSRAASSTGYKEWKKFMDGVISKEEAINLWTTSEHQYQKRQLTWFQKNPQIKWFDIYQKTVDDLVADILDAC